jgi:hypothetical protein
VRLGLHKVHCLSFQPLCITVLEPATAGSQWLAVNYSENPLPYQSLLNAALSHPVHVCVLQ